MLKQIDTTNTFFVSIQGDHIVVLRPSNRFDREQARNFAAWLLVMSECLPPSDADASFEELCEAIRNT